MDCGMIKGKQNNFLKLFNRVPVKQASGNLFSKPDITANVSLSRFPNYLQVSEHL